MVAVILLCLCSGCEAAGAVGAGATGGAGGAGQGGAGNNINDSIDTMPAGPPVHCSILYDTILYYRRHYACTGAVHPFSGNNIAAGGASFLANWPGLSYPIPALNPLPPHRH